MATTLEEREVAAARTNASRSERDTGMLIASIARPASAAAAAKPSDTAVGCRPRSSRSRHFLSKAPQMTVTVVVPSPATTSYEETKRKRKERERERERGG